jgi:hypothetical protein
MSQICNELKREFQHKLFVIVFIYSSFHYPNSPSSANKERKVFYTRIIVPSSDPEYLTIL